MEPPNTNWHPIFIGEKMVDELEKDFREFEEELVEYVEKRYPDGVNEHETSELVAHSIGNIAIKLHEDHIRSRIDDADPTEEEVALSYIGACAMEKAD